MKHRGLEEGDKWLQLRAYLLYLPFFRLAFAPLLRRTTLILAQQRKDIKI